MPKLKTEVIELLEEIKQELDSNGGKISEEFKEAYAEKCTYEYGKIGDSCRVCAMKTTTGDNFAGVAFVLDPNNDVEEVGNGYAKKDVLKNLGRFLGGFAKMLA